MKSLENKIKKIDQSFDSIFSNNEDYDVDAKVIASKILSEIDLIADKRELSRKEIASMIGTSASYITQLYRGNKLMNLITLAKLKRKLNLKIDINITELNYNDSIVATYPSYIKQINSGGQFLSWTILSNIINEPTDKNDIVMKANNTTIKNKVSA